MMIPDHEERIDESTAGGGGGEINKARRSS